ncbi:MAG TPA: glycosyltransferase family 2 protein [Phyllobacterium sp.]|nr:glycosyltransferase family 2 protein [Phyllobacterium sp.]
MAKVDVVVPCYNYARFLEGCVRSVLNQSVKDVRVLIIDDASSDDSLLVARKLAQADPRVTVVGHAENMGHIDTYNEGIAWASAEYCLLLSADDLLVPGALERAVEVMDANPDVVLTHGECIQWHDHLPIPDIDPVQNHAWERHDLLKQLCATAKNIWTPTVIARTKTQKIIGGYSSSLPHTGDLEMWLRFAANGSVAYVNAVQAIYRTHSAQMSNAYSTGRMRDFWETKLAFDSFFDEYENSLENSRVLRIVARRALARRIFVSGVELLVRMRLNDGLRLIRASMDMDPRLRYRPPALWVLLKGTSKVMARLRNGGT